MSDDKPVIAAHRGESDDARAYEDVTSPFGAERLLLLPLCAEKLAPEKVVAPLRLSTSGCKLCVMIVPVLKEKLVPECKPGWAGDHPCARCVMERWSEILGGDPAWRGQARLERPEFEEEVEGDDPTLLDFVRRNPPGFTFLASSPPAVPVAHLKRSGKPVAMFLGRFLLVQSRRRTLRPEDIDALLGTDVPPAQAATQEVGVGEGERPTLDDNALYEPEWVARFLGIAMGTLYNRVSQGRIPYIKDGRNIRFLGSQLREWLEARARWPTGSDEGEDPGNDFPWRKGRDGAGTR
jgi:excisionase family DNA binding protein